MKKKGTIQIAGKISNQKSLSLNLRLHKKGTDYLLIEGLKRFKDDFFKMLDGSFSIIINTDDETIAVRSRCGNAPLYLDEQNNEISISLKPFSKRYGLDLIALQDIQIIGYPLENRTLLKGIRTLPPGTIYRPGRSLKTKKITNSSKRKFKDPVAAFIEIISEQMEIFSAKRAGIALSGGIDSSFLAMLSKDNTCYTLKGNEDEPNARLIAKRYQKRLKVFSVSQRYLASSLRSFVSMCESIDSEFLGQFALITKVSLHTKEIITGYGIEKLFSGFLSHQDPGRIINRIQRNLTRLKKNKLKVINPERYEKIITEIKRNPQEAAYRINISEPSIYPSNPISDVTIITPFMSNNMFELAEALKQDRLRGLSYDKMILKQASLRVGLPKQITERKKSPGNRKIIEGKMDRLNEHCRKKYKGSKYDSYFKGSKDEHIKAALLSYFIDQFIKAD